MTDIRQRKVDLIADDIPLLEVSGPESGDLLVLSWGGTYGACTTAAERSRAAGLSVAHAHLRWLNPFPENLGQLLGQYRRVLIPELNMGQLRAIIRSTFLVNVEGLNKVKGKPFAVTEITAKIRELIG